MKTKTWLAALGVILGLGWTTDASAYVFVSSDSLTVTITPNANYSLDIDTATASLDLGVLALDASTFTVKPATVTIGSSFATTDVRVLTQITGGWTLDANTATREDDALQAWAVFSDTGLPSSPVSAGAFSGTVFGANNSDVLGVTTAQYAGTNAGVTQYVLGAGEADYKTMDGIPSNSVDAPASSAHLWLKFRLPLVTTVVAAQNVTVTLGAAAPVP